MEAKAASSFLNILNYNYKLRNEQRLVPECPISYAAKSTVTCTVPANIDELDDARAANDDAARYTRKGSGDEGPRIT
jgi:hypothetical protein